MQPSVIFAAFLLLAVLVLFGSNPIADAQREYMEKYAGKDALIVSIEEHQEKQQNGLFSRLPGGGGSVPRASASGDMGGAPSYPSHMVNPVSPFAYQDQNAGVQSSGRPPAGAPGGAAEAYLRSGERIRFVGAEVYRVDSSGRQTRLPDGEYALYGNDRLVVRDGKRAITAN